MDDSLLKFHENRRSQLFVVAEACDSSTEGFASTDRLVCEICLFPRRSPYLQYLLSNQKRCSI